MMLVEVEHQTGPTAAATKNRAPAKADQSRMGFLGDRDRNLDTYSIAAWRVPDQPTASRSTAVQRLLLFGFRADVNRRLARVEPKPPQPLLRL